MKTASTALQCANRPIRDRHNFHLHPFHSNQHFSAHRNTYLTCGGKKDASTKKENMHFVLNALALLAALQGENFGPTSWNVLSLFCRDTSCLQRKLISSLASQQPLYKCPQAVKRGQGTRSRPPSRRVLYLGRMAKIAQWAANIHPSGDGLTMSLSGQFSEGSGQPRLGTDP